MVENDAADSCNIIICTNCGATNYIYPIGIAGDKNYCKECGEEL